MFRFFCLLIGYAFRCFQTAYIVGRLTKKIDIREHGSKNAGMTNATRVLGRSAGLIVFVTDIIKAILAFSPRLSSAGKTESYPDCTQG